MLGGMLRKLELAQPVLPHVPHADDDLEVRRRSDPQIGAEVPRFDLVQAVNQQNALLAQWPTEQILIGGHPARQRGGYLTLLNGPGVPELQLLDDVFEEELFRKNRAVRLRLVQPGEEVIRGDLAVQLHEPHGKSGLAKARRSGDDQIVRIRRIHERPHPLQSVLPSAEASVVMEQRLPDRALERAPTWLAEHPFQKAVVEFVFEFPWLGEGIPNQFVDARLEGGELVLVLRIFWKVSRVVGDETEPLQAASVRIVELQLGDGFVVTVLNIAVAVGNDSDIDVGLIQFQFASGGCPEAHRLELLHSDGRNLQSVAHFVAGLSIVAEVSAGAADEGFHRFLRFSEVNWPRNEASGTQRRGMGTGRYHACREDSSHGPES